MKISDKLREVYRQYPKHVQERLDVLEKELLRTAAHLGDFRDQDDFDRSFVIFVHGVMQAITPGSSFNRFVPNLPVRESKIDNGPFPYPDDDCTGEKSC